MSSCSRALLVLLTGTQLAACTLHDVKASIYEAIYQKDCQNRLGRYNCDPEHMSYGEYQRERERILNAEEFPPSR